MKRNIVRLTVRGYELDSFGHVNNAVYLQYAEHAVWSFMKSTGLLDMIMGSGLFPVVMESKLRYCHELKLMDEVRIESEYQCTSGRILCDHHIINETTGDVACKVKAKIMLITRDRMIHDVPEELMNYLERDGNETNND